MEESELELNTKWNWGNDDYKYVALHNSWVMNKWQGTLDDDDDDDDDDELLLLL